MATVLAFTGRSYVISEGGRVFFVGEDVTRGFSRIYTFRVPIVILLRPSDKADRCMVFVRRFRGRSWGGWRLNSCRGW